MQTFERGSDDRSPVADLVKIAMVDLPAVASLGAVALQAGDRDLERSMLTRAYVAAVEADCDYLAELADRELCALEHDGHGNAA